MLFWPLQAQTCTWYKHIPVSKLSYTVIRSPLLTEKLSAVDIKEKGKIIFLQFCVSEDITHCRIGVVPRKGWPTQNKLHVVFSVFLCVLFFFFILFFTFWPSVCFNMFVFSFHFITLVGCGGRKRYRSS